MDLIDDPRSGENAPEFSVSEISGAVKKTVEGAFGHVRVKGEVGRVMHARSGHLYFDIKDDRAVLGCTTWKAQVARLNVIPEEGMEIVATGRLTTFPNQSKYQMNVQDVSVAGVGALMAMLEKRKTKLAAEGLFDPARKSDIPFLPDVIGVVTSPTGAVIRDILHRLRDRFPRKVLVWPVAVQGANCAAEVTRAIEGFNAMTPGGALPRPDVLIVARGGGSIEDLWGFNEENVARAAAASDIPLISAVGHETDTTLIDYVSDRRAPTPTAAAEMAVPVRLDMLAFVNECGGRLSRGLANGMTRRADRLRDLARGLPRPERLTEDQRQRLDAASDRLDGALNRFVSTKRVALADVAGGVRPTVLSARIAEARRRTDDRARQLVPALTRKTERRREALAGVSARLRPAVVASEITRRRERTGMLGIKMSGGATQRITTARATLDGLERLRKTLGYEATLERGFAVVRSAGAVITQVDDARASDALEIQFKDGCVSLGSATGPRDVEAAVKKPSTAPKKRSKKDDTPPEQGTLL